MGERRPEGGSPSVAQSPLPEPVAHHAVDQRMVFLAATVVILQTVELFHDHAGVRVVGGAHSREQRLLFVGRVTRREIREVAERRL